MWGHVLRWRTLKAVTCCTVTARLSLVPATLRALWLTRSSRAISPSACALSMFSLYSTKRQNLAAESAGQPPLSAWCSPACPFSPLLRLFRCRCMMLRHHFSHGFVRLLCRSECIRACLGDAQASSHSHMLPACLPTACPPLFALLHTLDYLHSDSPYWCLRGTFHAKSITRYSCRSWRAAMPQTCFGIDLRIAICSQELTL